MRRPKIIFSRALLASTRTTLQRRNLFCQDAGIGARAYRHAEQSGLSPICAGKNRRSRRNRRKHPENRPEESGRLCDAVQFARSRKRITRQALATCETVVSIDPTVADAHCKSGYILNLAGKYREALEFSDRALELQPQFVEAFLCRGNSLRNLNRHEEALAAYGEAVSLKPDLFQAWLKARGDSFADLNHHDEAIAAYDKALLLNSDLPAAWLGRGNVLGRLGRYEEAIVGLRSCALEVGSGAGMGLAAAMF